MSLINEILKNSNYGLALFDDEINWLEGRIIVLEGKKGKDYKIPCIIP